MLCYIVRYYDFNVINQFLLNFLLFFFLFLFFDYIFTHIVQCLYQFVDKISRQTRDERTNHEEEEERAHQHARLDVQSLLAQAIVYDERGSIMLGHQVISSKS